MSICADDAIVFQFVCFLEIAHSSIRFVIKFSICFNRFSAVFSAPAIDLVLGCLHIRAFASLCKHWFGRPECSGTTGFASGPAQSSRSACGPAQSSRSACGLAKSSRCASGLARSSRSACGLAKSSRCACGPARSSRSKPQQIRIHLTCNVVPGAARTVPVRAVPGTPRAIRNRALTLAIGSTCAAFLRSKIELRLFQVAFFSREVQRQAEPRRNLSHFRFPYEMHG
jgi:hypothetical protein